MGNEQSANKTGGGIGGATPSTGSNKAVKKDEPSMKDEIFSHFFDTRWLGIKINNSIPQVLNINLLLFVLNRKTWIPTCWILCCL